MALLQGLEARGMRHPLALLLSQSLIQSDGALGMAAPFRLSSYTVTTLPTAADWTGAIIYVSNGTANKRLAVSDGTNWRWPDGAIVS